MRNALETLGRLQTSGRRFAVLGEMNDSGQLKVTDALTGDDPVDMRMSDLLGKPPQTRKDVTSIARDISFQALLASRFLSDIALQALESAGTSMAGPNTCGLRGDSQDASLR